MKSARVLVLAVGAILALGQQSEAQVGPVASECASDIAEFCSGITHGGRAVRSCLEEHSADVSEACRRALETTGPMGGFGAGMGRQGQMMTPQEISSTLVDQGYSDIREIEFKGRATYEVKARDQQSNRVELYVDGVTGRILRSEPDN